MLKIRRAVQWTFLALNVWIGFEFYRFVRFYETGGRTAWAERPPGVEGWLPIAGLMNIKSWLLTGHMPPMHAAGMFLLVAFLAMSLLFRKSFCGWLCPVGTVSEWLWRLGRQTFRRNFELPRWLDIPLRGLKYALLVLFLYAVASMPVAAIRAFLDGPYGIIADVKMLNFFRFLGLAGGLVLAALVLLSVFFQNFWCRYLCPYGALAGLAGLLSPLGIRRDESVCIDCAECARACPSLLPVDKLVRVRSAECTACLECVAVCPSPGALEVRLAPLRRAVPAWVLAAAIAAVFLGTVAIAHRAGYWHTNLPSQVYFDLIPRAQEFTHP